MIRSGICALLLVYACSSAAVGQEWARKMFKESSHDFGVVARAAKTVYRFELQNVYEEPIHIVGVRASCGCTKASISKPTLKTWEVGEIIAEIDTRNFTGQRNATITVTIDRPYRAEVQLQVHVNIRTDVVFNPGIVDLGVLDQGTSAAKKVEVNYAGRSDWSILDVRSASEFVQVELAEKARGGGKVAYEMVVHLDENAPPGIIADQLVLVTNDRNYQTIPLEIQGRVVPELTVTPETLVLGDVAGGEEITEKLIVRGKAPFKVVDVLCDDESFTFEAGEDAKTLQIVTLKYRAPEKAGKIRQLVRIVTDRDQREVTLEATATVTAREEAVQEGQVTAVGQ